MTDSRPPLEDPERTDRTEAQLERYAMATRDMPPRGFADSVMARIEREPRPRRGLLAGLIAGPGAWRRPMQVAALTLVIVLGTGGALVGAQLVGWVRTTASPSPSVLPSPPSVPTSPSPSIAPTPAPTSSVSPSSTPTPTGRATPTPSHASASPSGSAEATKTPKASATPHPSETPEASDDHGASSGPGGGSGTPKPSNTPED